jgi:hypothetical protein
MTFEQYEMLQKSSINGILLKIMNYKRSAIAHGGEQTKFRFLGKTVPAIRTVPSCDAILVMLEGATVEALHFHYSEIELVGNPLQLTTEPVKCEYDLNSYNKFFETKQ